MPGMFHDTATIAGPGRITKDGYFVASARVGRADNIQEYTAGELNLADRAPSDIVKVFRPADQVFHKDALASLANRPVTKGHPPDGVDSGNWKSHAIGDVGSDILRDGEFITVPFKIMDAGGVSAIQSDHQEFSLGYTANIVPVAGIHDGQTYEFEARDFRYNHLAAVPNARGGSQLRIIDERTTPPEKEAPMSKKIMIDGLPVDLGDIAAVEAVLAKNATALADGATALTDANAKLSEATGKIAVLEKQLSDAKDAASPASLDARVADRAKLVNAAKAVKPDLVTDGKDDSAIRREVVAASLGDAATALDDAAIGGAFIALTGQVKIGDVQNIAPAPASTIVTDASIQDAQMKALNGWRAAA